MTDPLLSIAGLSAISDRDGGAPILRDVALTLERGEVRGLVGESGAGKSTIAKALLGILPRFNRARQAMSETEANAASVRIELQADCFAGIWGKFTDQKGLLEKGDLEEALNAANQIGDDALQKQAQGYVVPDSFTHGTSEQRAKWFTRGFQTGKLSACDTSTGPL